MSKETNRKYHNIARIMASDSSVVQEVFLGLFAELTLDEIVELIDS